MQIITCYRGGKLAIGVMGTQEEREQKYNLFFNFGCVAPNLSNPKRQDDEGPERSSLDRGANYLHEYGKDFSYFFVDSSRAAVKALAQYFFVQAQTNGESKQFKGKPRVFCLYCIRKAYLEFKSWSVENFLGQNLPVAKAFRELDGGAVEWAAEFEE